MINSEFYNPEIKQRFLDYKKGNIQDQSVGVYERIFKLFAEDEKWYNMDLCDFNLPALINVLSNKMSRSYASRCTQLSQLREYEAWCTENNIKKNNDHPIQSIRVDDIDVGVQIRKQFIKCPKHLRSILDNILKSEKEDFAFDIMFRMVCWLLYYGFKEQEVIELTKWNVDFENNRIANDRINITMDNELKHLILKAIDIKETYRKGRGGYIVLPLEEGDYLIRKTARKDASEDKLSYLRQMLSILRRTYKENNYEIISLSPQRLWLSGIFYRIYTKEQNAILNEQDFMYNIDDMNDKYQIKNRINQNKREYKDWKNAFNL